MTRYPSIGDRYKTTIDFIEKALPEGSRILDLGTPNKFTELLTDKGFTISNTGGEDLDIEPGSVKKHEVDAVTALEDENALTIEDEDHNESRFKTLGMGPGLNILYVIYTFYAKDHIRIISARKADRSEVKQYYRGINYE